MKYFKLLTCASAALMLAACAQTRTDVETRVGYVTKLDPAEGTHKVEIVKTVSRISRSACSVIDFVVAVTSEDPSIHDVINIRADEFKTVSDDGEVKGKSCKYWGIAVRYIPVEPVQAPAQVSATPVKVAQPVAQAPVQAQAAPQSVPVQYAPAPARTVAPAPVPAVAPAPAPVAVPAAAPVQAPAARPAPVSAPAVSEPVGETFTPTIGAPRK